MLIILLPFIVLVGCGGQAPLASKNAKWYDYTDPKNEHLLPPRVSASTLAKLKNIKLDLGGNAVVTDADLAAIRDLKNLVVVEAYLTSLTDQSIEHLVNLPLEVLGLNQTQIGDKGLESIGKIKTLRRLELFDTKVTDAGLKHLEKLPLFRIDLSKTAVTNAGMAEIAKIEGLERLVVTQTAISDEGLAFIGTIESLQELDIAQAGDITDVGLKHLYNLKALKALFLGDSKYSPEGLKALRRALPNCEIAGNEPTPPGN